MVVKMTKQESFWKLENNIKIFFISDKKIGDFLTTVKHLMGAKGMSSSNAHKTILKIKQFHGDKNASG
jgi:hypothetical protein